jgi:hypothetical protein
MGRIIKKMIKKILKEDDWDWIEADVNPWVEYNVLLFDIIPTEEEINKYVKMALESKNVINYDDWLVGRNQDLEWIIRYSKTPGGSVLMIHRNELSYADYKTYQKNYQRKKDKVINYSQLISKNDLTESDDFDWIRDLKTVIPAKDLKPNDRFMITQIEDKSLEDYLDNDLLNKIDPHTTVFKLDEDNNFTGSGGAFNHTDYYVEGDTVDIWLRPDKQTFVSGWVNVHNIMITLV